MSVLEYKCPCCGAPLAFSSEQQTMHCTSCVNDFSIETVQQYAEASKESAQGDHFGWESYGEQNGGWQEEEQMRVFICPSCGGEIIADATTAATRCPYCDNNAILEERLKGSFRPDLIIPFKVQKEEAQKQLKLFCKGKKLLPKEFASKNRVESLTGMYVPFWLFDCDSKANMQFHAKNTRTWRSGNYQYTRTDHYLLVRNGEVGFEKVPVDGSKKMLDAYMEAIEPYDYSEAIDFHTAYLSGYLADKYDVDAETSKIRANERIKSSTQSIFSATALGYHTVVPTHTGIRFENGKIRYALLPVWMLNTVYEGKTYTFAMNGQTGKFVGELPVSRKRYWTWFGGISGVLGLIFALIATFL